MSSLDLTADVAFAAAPPCFFDGDTEPVLPGFERIATAVDYEADRVLVDDLEISPAMQSLIDDTGGES